MTTVTPSSPLNNKALQPSRDQARYAFIVLLIINILNYADRYVLAAIQTTLQKDFALTDTELGILSSAFLLIYALATLPLGVWADKSVRKNIVAACVGVWSLATFLGGMTFNFIQLLLVRSVLGIGEAGYAPASLSLLGDYFPKERRGRVLSIWSVSNLIGTALGLIVGGFVAEKLGWRWAFYIVGIPGMIAAFLIWRAHEPARGTFDDDDNETADDAAGAAHGHGGLGKDFLNTVRHLMRIPTYWVLVIAFIFSFFTIGSASVWLPTFLQRTFTLTPGQAGGISGGVLAGGSLLGTLAGGWLADYLQRRRPQGRMIVATIAFLVGAPLTFFALLLPLAAQNGETIASVPVLIPFLIIFIFAIIALSLCLGPLNAVIQDVVVPEMRATAIGFVLLVAHLLGDAFSPLLVGVIADRSSLGFALISTAPICLLIAGLFCLIGLRTVAKDMQAMHRQLHER